MNDENLLYNPLDVMDAKILIIDDNLSNVLVLEKMLLIIGYNKKNIIKTIDSRNAVELFLEHQPNLVLLDLQMPFLDGFQVLKQLNSLSKGKFLAVIIITAQSESENHVKALSLGARDFIEKPFDHAVVAMRIKNLLEMEKMHRQIKDYTLHLENKVLERTKEVEEIQFDFIKRLLRAAEFRDNDTGMHIQRIGLYSKLLAEKIGMSPLYCDLIEHASMMHDIGKIAIPDDIVLKPGKLNSTEWIKMREHAEKGASILNGSQYKLLQLAEEIALTHHEKWDGTGYPRGLKGKEIPLSGRITAICDVFDALISKRPYKEAWSLEEAINEIKRSSGSHFDTRLVEVFVENIDEMISIFKNNN